MSSGARVPFRSSCVPLTSPRVSLCLSARKQIRVRAQERAGSGSNRVLGFKSLVLALKVAYRSVLDSHTNTIHNSNKVRDLTAVDPQSSHRPDRHHGWFERVVTCMHGSQDSKSVRSTRHFAGWENGYKTSRTLERRTTLTNNSKWGGHDKKRPDRSMENKIGTGENGVLLVKLHAQRRRHRHRKAGGGCSALRTSTRRWKCVEVDPYHSVHTQPHSRSSVVHSAGALTR